MIKKLVLTGGPRERDLLLAGRIVVGRDPVCEISHDDSLLSRRHAEFVTAGEIVTVRDLNSRNGVYVNGARTVEHVLTPGDVIQVGPLRAQYVVEDASLGIEPHELDGERTAVIRKTFAAGQVELDGGLGAGVATVDAADDDAVTGMLPAPRLPSTEKPMPNAYASAMLLDDDAPTQFGRSPAVSAAPIVAAPPPARVADTTTSVAIVVPILSLTMIVLAATAIPLLLGRPTAWLMMPALIAVAGSYLVATSIHRRMLEAAGGRDRT